MKKSLSVIIALWGILVITSPCAAYTVIVENCATMDSFSDNIYANCVITNMAEVNFYYNAIVNVNALTVYIPQDDSHIYNSGKWCPSGVTGTMHVQAKCTNRQTGEKFTRLWHYIILAADNRGNHSGLHFACQSSTFKIQQYEYGWPANNFHDNKTFRFIRQ